MSVQLEPLTEKDVALLKASFRTLDRHKLAMRFYTSLFARYPRLQSLFPSDLTELSNKIVSVFELVVYSFELQGDGHFRLQPEVIKPLRSLGILHEKKGVENHHYPLANEMLLESIRLESPGFSAQHSRAWKLALNHLTFAMISPGAGEEAAHASAKESYQYIRSLLFRVEE